MFSIFMAYIYIACLHSDQVIMVLVACFRLQILTYLLLSASTSAAIVARLLQAFFIYADNFVEMTNVSVALSFFAFKAFALATLVSGYILCRFKG